MAKYEAAVLCGMDELVTYVELCLGSGRAPAVLRESSELRCGGLRCCIRVYERFDFPSLEQAAVSLIFVEDGSRVHVTAIATGQQSCFGRENNLKNYSEPYFIALIKGLLAKYQLQEAG